MSGRDLQDTKGGPIKAPRRRVGAGSSIRVSNANSGEINALSPPKETDYPRKEEKRAYRVGPSASKSDNVIARDNASVTADSEPIDRVSEKENRGRKKKSRTSKQTLSDGNESGLREYFYRLDEQDTSDDDSVDGRSTVSLDSEGSAKKQGRAKRDQKSIKCCVCEMEHKPSSVTYRPVSTSEDGGEVEELPFCRRDNKRWITTMGAPLTLKTIKMAIEKKWGIYILGDGSKIFTSGSKKKSGMDYDSDT